MKVLSQVSIAQRLAKALKKPVLFLSFRNWEAANIDDIFKAAPYLSLDDNETGQAMGDGYAVIVCDSIKEQNFLYDSTVGDDGPTKLNKYNGPYRIYALTIDKTGQTLNENT